MAKREGFRCGLPVGVGKLWVGPLCDWLRCILAFSVLSWKQGQKLGEAVRY